MACGVWRVAVWLDRRTSNHILQQTKPGFDSGEMRDMEQDKEEMEEEARPASQQIRITFRLAPNAVVPDNNNNNDSSSLVVPSDVIAIPSHLTRKGLSAVINHLLGRDERDQESDDADADDDDEEKDENHKAGLLLQPPLQFEFLVGPESRRLLRTTLDKEVRQAGLSLEQAVVVTYFPATPFPHPNKEDGPHLPDWIAALQTVTLPTSFSSRHGGNNDDSNDNAAASDFLVSACYDGSLHILQPASKRKNNPSLTATESLRPLASISKAHTGPVQCMDATTTTAHSINNHNSPESTIWMATGSMDHTAALHAFNPTIDDSSTMNDRIACRATATHAASVSSVKFWPRRRSNDAAGSESSSIDNGERSGGNELHLATGDWDGGVFVWRYNPPSRHSDNDNNNGGGRSAAGDVDHHVLGPSHKKQKASTSTTLHLDDAAPQRLTPTISIQAHTSKVSGLAFFGGGTGKGGGSNHHAFEELMVTGSWDHSIKVWNMERQDCLLSLNSSRVVGCLDTSPHSPGICVTGHPDCSLRLWDVRVNAMVMAVSQQNKEKKNENDAAASNILISENIFRPSHKAWISSVQWSHHDPYQLYTASHDGTFKLWDIRSSTPLHTVRVWPSNHDKNNNQDKLLCLATTMGTNTNTIFVGGTTCIVEQFQLRPPSKMTLTTFDVHG